MHPFLNFILSTSLDNCHFTKTISSVCWHAHPDNLSSTVTTIFFAHCVVFSSTSFQQMFLFLGICPTFFIPCWQSLSKKDSLYHKYISTLMCNFHHHSCDEITNLHSRLENLPILNFPCAFVIQESGLGCSWIFTRTLLQVSNLSTFFQSFEHSIFFEILGFENIVRCLF